MNHDIQIEMKHGEPFLAKGCQQCITLSLQPKLTNEYGFALEKHIMVSSLGCSKCNSQNPEYLVFYRVQFKHPPQEEMVNG